MYAAKRASRDVPFILTTATRSESESAAPRAPRPATTPRA
jgi:hypothetical protein